MRKIFFTLFITITLVGFLGTKIFAVPDTTSTKPTGQALEIAPTVFPLTLNPGETKIIQINIRNVSSGKLIVTSQVNDFGAADEIGTPKIDFDEKPDNNPYSIINWIDPIPSYTLVSRQIKNVKVNIHVPANASPGGRYGVVRFTGTPPEIDDTGVSLSASVGSLLFVRIKGDVTEKLSVKEFFTSDNEKSTSLFEYPPVELNERIENTGNIHEQPTGKVTITDMFNNKIADVNVNLTKNNILPGSIRKFTQKLDSGVIGNKWLFGRYTADLKLNYGDDGKKMLTSSLVFWVIPWRLIIIIIVILIGGFFGIRFIIRRYNDHVINRSHGHRPYRRK